MMNILLLEDDKILCDSLREFLELEGYCVDVAYRGPEVFDLTFDKKYDLYILDVNVPEVDGFDVLASLRETGDETPAIYITALTDINSISKGSMERVSPGLTRFKSINLLRSNSISLFLIIFRVNAVPYTGSLISFKRYGNAPI